MPYTMPNWPQPSNAETPGAPIHTRDDVDLADPGGTRREEVKSYCESNRSMGPAELACAPPALNKRSFGLVRGDHPVADPAGGPDGGLLDGVDDRLHLAAGRSNW